MADWPHVSDDPRVQALYELSRSQGNDHRFAEMCAFRCPPGTGGTDRAFLEGHCNGNQFADDPVYGEIARRKAKAAGVDITGKVYKSGLATEPADPKAWVSGLGDVKRLCEQNGWECDRVGTKLHAVEGDTKPKVAKEIVDREVAKEVLANPGKKRKMGEVREAVIDRMKPDR